jgi:hypothetical protein
MKEGRTSCLWRLFFASSGSLTPALRPPIKVRITFQNSFAWWFYSSSRTTRTEPLRQVETQAHKGSSYEKTLGLGAVMVFGKGPPTIIPCSLTGFVFRFIIN